MGRLEASGAERPRTSFVVVEQLEVCVLDEPRTVSTSDELAEVLAMRIDGGNHFEVASATSTFPMLDVMVHGSYPVVHWFAHEGATGEQAGSDVDEAPEEVAFRHSALGEMITMPGSVLVDAGTATACIERFAETLSRPTLVGWIDL